MVINFESYFHVRDPPVRSAMRLPVRGRMASRAECRRDKLYCPGCIPKDLAKKERLMCPRRRGRGERTEGRVPAPWTNRDPGREFDVPTLLRQQPDSARDGPEDRTDQRAADSSSGTATDRLGLGHRLRHGRKSEPEPEERDATPSQQ